jgi:hypothetical protein
MFLQVPALNLLVLNTDGEYPLNCDLHGNGKVIWRWSETFVGQVECCRAHPLRYSKPGTTGSIKVAGTPTGKESCSWRIELLLTGAVKLYVCSAGCAFGLTLALGCKAALGGCSKKLEDNTSRGAF